MSIAIQTFAEKLTDSACFIHTCVMQDNSTIINSFRFRHIIHLNMQFSLQGIGFTNLSYVENVNALKKLITHSSQLMTNYQMN